MGGPSFTHRTAYVHVGTHKTGTTSIQALLAMNERLFGTAGVYVPNAGRTAPGFASHHNIAWELAGNPQFDRQYGTFETLLQEAACIDATTLCLTSEEFEFLHLDKSALCRLRDGLYAAGYKPRIILYLRSQADYLESLYAEASRVWNIPFGEFLDTIVDAGIYGCSRFDYDRLTSAFSDVFGSDCLTVRAYRSKAPTNELLREFAAIIAPPTLNPAHLAIPERLNPMVAFPDVIAARERHISCTARHAIAENQRFDPLSLLDLVRIFVRFSRSNERVRQTFGARVASVTTTTFARELITELFHDRDSRFRKRLIRALVETPARAAPRSVGSHEKGSRIVLRRSTTR